MITLAVVNNCKHCFAMAAHLRRSKHEHHPRCSCFFFCSSCVTSSLSRIRSIFDLCRSSSFISSRAVRYSVYAAFFFASSSAYSACRDLTVGSFLPQYPSVHQPEPHILSPGTDDTWQNLLLLSALHHSCSLPHSSIIVYHTL